MNSVSQALDRDNRQTDHYVIKEAVAGKYPSIRIYHRLKMLITSLLIEPKTPWRYGTMPVIFEPLDFISRLVSLVPQPRVNLTRFHGVFAPNSKYRAKMTLVRRGKRKKSYSADEAD